MYSKGCFFIFLYCFSFLVQADNLRVNKRIHQIIYTQLHNTYLNKVNSFIKQFNSTIKDPQATETILKKYGIFSGQNSKFTSFEAKAVKKNDMLLIKGTDFSYSFHDYLQGTISYKGKRLTLNCQDILNCLQEFKNSYLMSTTKKTTYFSFLFPLAYANTAIDLFSGMGNSDYKTLVTLIVMNESFKEVDEGFATFFGNTDQENLAIVKENIKSLHSAIEDLNYSCYDWKEYSSGNISSLSKMFNFIKALLTMQDDNSFDQKLEQKLGKEVFSYVGLKDSDASFQKFRKWNNLLSCENANGLNSLLNKSANKIEQEHLNTARGSLRVHTQVENIPTDKDVINDYYVQLKESVQKNPNVYWNSSRYELTREVNHILRKIDKDLLPTDALRKRAQVETNMKDLYIQHKLLVWLNDDFISTTQYCDDLEKLKLCLKDYYNTAAAQYNSQRMDDYDKSNFEEVFDLDENISTDNEKIRAIER